MVVHCRGRGKTPISLCGKGKTNANGELIDPYTRYMSDVTCPECLTLLEDVTRCRICKGYGCYNDHTVDPPISGKMCENCGGTGFSKRIRKRSNG